MTTSSDDIRTQLDASAQGPKKASGDEGSIEQHDLPDVIDADRYARSRNKPNKNLGGLRFTKIVPPGTA